ncbi:MAG TPA: hypothetical protein VHW24_06365, partial [Bryobacteraceae bacterium]|nr:hypothetical protein [Bryobacteraceae bacterium]
EVAFLFAASPEEADQQLRALHIERVAYYPRSLNTRYLATTSPFYATLPQRWIVGAQVPNLLYILHPRQ